jgi:hypothetical protein
VIWDFFWSVDDEEDGIELSYGWKNLDGRWAAKEGTFTYTPGGGGPPIFGGGSDSMHGRDVHMWEGDSGAHGS